MSTLVLVFHDAIENSRINKQLASSAAKNYVVHYVTSDFNVAEEQALLTQYDKIVLQYPVQWFYGPTVLKKWFDLVLSYGFAYGPQFALEGKKFALALSFGGVAEAYAEGGVNGITVGNVAHPVKASLSYVKALPQDDVFVVHNVYGLSDADVELKADEYHAWLSQ